jgi:hypothetical protein
VKGGPRGRLLDHAYTGFKLMQAWDSLAPSSANYVQAQAAPCKSQCGAKGHDCFGSSMSIHVVRVFFDRFQHQHANDQTDCEAFGGVTS